MAYFKNLANIVDFEKIVKPLWTHEIEDFGLHPYNVSGCFFPDNLEELVAFCQKHNKYHIICGIAGFMHFNQIFPWAEYYRLAYGSKDPRLATYPRETIDSFLENLRLKLLFRERLAEDDHLVAVQQLIINF